MKAMRTWGLSAFTVVLILAWLALTLSVPSDLTFLGVPAALSLALGTLIVARVGRNTIGIVMIVAGAAWLIYDSGNRYALLSLEQGPFPAEHLAAWLGAWTGPIFYASFPTLLLLFPDGRAVGWRKWFLSLPALAVVMAAGAAWRLWYLPADVLADIDQLKALPEYSNMSIAFPASLGLVVPATVSLVVRFKGGTRIQRQQIKWLMIGALAFAIGLTVTIVTEQDQTLAMGLVMVVGMSLFPITIGLAIFRYRLFEIDRIISRTISYTLVAGLLAALVAAAATVVGAQFHQPLVVAATTLAVAASFNPLRKRVQRLVDRRFNRVRYDSERVVDRFTGTLRGQVDPQGVLDGWVGVVSETMQPQSMGVWVREP